MNQPDTLIREHVGHTTLRLRQGRLASDTIFLTLRDEKRGQNLPIALSPEQALSAAKALIELAEAAASEPAV